jgi:hypothetical protein
MDMSSNLEDLGISKVLAEAGFTEEQIQLAATQIVSRAVYPASELKTASWIKENSAIGELTGYDCEKITKDRLYESALRLYAVKDQLEQHLSHKTNELFDISDKIVLYDLTNTYFEGQYSGSELAKYGRSKEKRNALANFFFQQLKYFFIQLASNKNMLQRF